MTAAGRKSWNLLYAKACLTGDDAWLQTAPNHATDAMKLFLGSPPPRMSLGRSHYEAQQGSSVLVHSLARLILIAEGKECSGGLAQPVS